MAGSCAGRTRPVCASASGSGFAIGSSRWKRFSQMPGIEPKEALKLAYTTQVARQDLGEIVISEGRAAMTNSVDIRAHLVDMFRRDLIGPGPQDADLAHERLNESPSRWYLTGFLAPADDPLASKADDEEDRSVGPGGDGDRRRGAGRRRRRRRRRR